MQFGLNTVKIRSFDGWFVMEADAETDGIMVSSSFL